MIGDNRMTKLLFGTASAFFLLNTASFAAKKP